jgi:LmbE family N-acetylglucosaminyl deacetylase
MKVILELLFAVHSFAQILIVTPHADDYLVCAGGTLAAMIQSGAKAYLVRVTNDDKDAYGTSPEQAAMQSRVESEEAAKILGVAEVISLGYRSGELGGVSPTELRDRIIFFIRQYGPRIMFIPNPYTHNDGYMDNYYVGSAAEEARWAAGLANFQPPHALVGLSPHLTPELFYYALPLDPDRQKAESTSTFVPQPKVVDISMTFERKLHAVQALKTRNRSLAFDIRERLSNRGKRLPLLDANTDDSVDKLTEIRLRGLAKLAGDSKNLPLAEEFFYAGGDYQIPLAYRKQ